MRVIVWVLLFSSASLNAQVQPRFSATEELQVRQLVTSYFTAIRSDDLKRAAMLFDDAEVSEMKAFAARLADNSIERGRHDEVREFLGDANKTGNDVRRMSNGEFLASFFRLSFEREPAILEATKNPRSGLVGCVRENETTGYCVFRLYFTMMDQAVERLDVWPVRRAQSAGWKIGMNPQLKGLMAIALK